MKACLARSFASVLLAGVAPALTVTACASQSQMSDFSGSWGLKNNDSFVSTTMVMQSDGTGTLTTNENGSGGASSGTRSYFVFLQQDPLGNYAILGCPGSSCSDTPKLMCAGCAANQNEIDCDYTNGSGVEIVCDKWLRASGTTP